MSLRQRFDATELRLEARLGATEEDVARSLAELQAGTRGGGEGGLRADGWGERGREPKTRGAGGGGGVGVQNRGVGGLGAQNGRGEGGREPNTWLQTRSAAEGKRGIQAFEQMGVSW